MTSMMAASGSMDSRCQDDNAAVFNQKSLNAMNVDNSNVSPGQHRFQRIKTSRDNLDRTALDKLDQLHVAASTGDIQSLEYLVKKNRRIMTVRSVEGLTAMHLAARHAQTEAIHKLVQLGMDFDIDNGGGDGRTPLFYAAEMGHVHVVSELLAMGALPDGQDVMGICPLSLACRQGHTDVVERLLRAGVNVHHQDEFGVQALNFAARNEAPEMITMLLNAGADPNMLADDDLTPVHQAAYRGHSRTLRALVRGYADPSGERVREVCCQVRDKIKYISPISLAIIGNHCDTVRELIKAGANLRCAVKFKTAIKWTIKETVDRICLENDQRHWERFKSSPPRESFPEFQGFSGIRDDRHRRDDYPTTEGKRDRGDVVNIFGIGLLDQKTINGFFGKFHPRHSLFRYTMNPLCYSVLTEKSDIIGALIKSKQYSAHEIERLRSLAEIYQLHQGVAAIDYYRQFLPPQQRQVLPARTVRNVIASARQIDSAIAQKGMETYFV